MAGALLRRFWSRAPKRAAGEADLQVDWSVISADGIGLVLKALLADLVGAPPPPEADPRRWKRGGAAWRRADVADTFFPSNLTGSFTSGFLIRGVVYDMQSLIQSRDRSSSESTGKAVPADYKSRDWTALVDADLGKEKEKPARAADGDGSVVKAADVMDALGLKADLIPGLAGRVQGGGQRGAKESSAAREEVAVKADGIRANYADRIRTKKMLADARRESRELGVAGDLAIRSTGSKKGWRVLPGTPMLIRYLEARGLHQGLIARGAEDDLESFLEQIGNYQFQHIYRDLQRGHAAAGNEKQELRAAATMRNICDSWGIFAKQILLVLGEGRDSQALIKQAADLGFFVCQVNGAQFECFEEESTLSLPAPTDDGTVRLDSEATNKSVKVELGHKQGLKTWFRKLATGTLDSDDHGQVVTREGVHFSVADMVELKWVVEELNGVSYRRSTMIRGFEEIVGRK